MVANGYILALFFFCVFINIDFILVLKKAKQNLANIRWSWPHIFFNNTCEQLCQITPSLFSTFSTNMFDEPMSFLSGRLRVNMGNIYYEQKKYPQAVKQYRMALDQVPNTHKDMRYKSVLLLYAGLLMQELLFSLVYKQGQSLW